MMWVSAGCARTAEPARCQLQGELSWDPPHFPARSEPRNHAASPLGRALGRRLFFDARLSSNGKVSCASCHAPEYAFSIPESLPTRGVSGRRLARHSPVLLNLAWTTRGFFWDGGSKNLESQALAPLVHADELGRGEDLEGLMNQLAADPQYTACFEQAYGPGGLTIGHVMDALAQYERSIIAADARWDAAQLGRLALTAIEQRGERVFADHCARCHTPPLFSDGDFHNNGLDGNFPALLSDERRGRARISRRAGDIGKYKTPTLRRLFDSAPYMHDGRFWSVAQVIQHYRQGIVRSDSLDRGFISASGRLGLTITDLEAADLEAFLRAL